MQALRDDYASVQEQAAEESAKKAYSGRLESQPRTLLSVADNIYPKLEFGDSGSMLLWAGPPGEPIFNFEGSPLTVELMNDQLVVSAILRDEDGRVIAEIIKNEWKVNPQNTWDRNYTKNALEVKDSAGDIVLQVRLVEDRVQLQAKIRAQDGSGLAFVKGRGGAWWSGHVPRDRFGL